MEFEFGDIRVWVQPLTLIVVAVCGLLAGVAKALLQGLQ